MMHVINFMFFKMLTDFVRDNHGYGVDCLTFVLLKFVVSTTIPAFEDFKCLDFGI